MNEAETTTEELRELIRQGHMLIKDLTGTMKELRKAKEDLHGLMEQVKSAPMDEVEKVIHQITEDASVKIAGEVSQVATDAMTIVEKAIYDRFDVLINTILGIDDREGRLSIPDILAARARGLDPKIDLDGLRRVASPIDRSRA